MSSFVNMIKTIAVPVAQVTAQLLPIVVAALAKTDGAAAAEAAPVTTGMVQWYFDAQTNKIYAVNDTEDDKSIVLAFTLQTETESVAGQYDVESVAIEISPHRMIDVTQDLSTYGAGSASTNYLYPVDRLATGDATVNPAMAQLVKHIPTLAALTFSLAGGGVEVSRGNADGRDYWRVQSTAKIDWLSFMYRNSATDTTLDFNNKPTPTPPTVARSTREQYAYDYWIDMDTNQSTGVLTDFSLTIDAERTEMAKLLKQGVEQIALTNLPERLRAQRAA